MIEVSDRLLTAASAAVLLGLQVSTVRRMTADGQLPYVKPTGRRAVRYRMSDLNDLLRMRSQPMRVQAPGNR